MPSSGQLQTWAAVYLVSSHLLNSISSTSLKLGNEPNTFSQVFLLSMTFLYVLVPGDRGREGPLFCLSSRKLELILLSSVLLKYAIMSQIMEGQTRQKTMMVGPTFLELHLLCWRWRKFPLLIVLATVGSHYAIGLLRSWAIGWEKKEYYREFPHSLWIVCFPSLQLVPVLEGFSWALSVYSIVPTGVLTGRYWEKNSKVTTKSLIIEFQTSFPIYLLLFGIPKELLCVFCPDFI